MGFIKFSQYHPNPEPKPCAIYSNSYINKVTYSCFSDGSSPGKLIHSKELIDFQTFLSKYDSKLNADQGRLYFAYYNYNNLNVDKDANHPLEKKSVTLTPYFQDCCDELGFVELGRAIDIKKIYLVNERFLYFVENDHTFFSVSISTVNHQVLPYGRSANLKNRNDLLYNWSAGYSFTGDKMNANKILVEEKLPQNRIELKIQEENPDLVFLFLPQNISPNVYMIKLKEGYTNVDFRNQWISLEDKIKIRRLVSPAYLLSTALDIALYPINLLRHLIYMLAWSPPG
ncbi:hypothetical protein AB3N59_06250 [Leptospira sp. WS92.C1]